MKISDPKAAASLGLEHISTQIPTKTSVEDSPEAIREASRAFEAIFVNEIMKSMRKTLPEDGMLNSGFANNVFNGMLDQEYSQITANSGQFGLAKIISDQLGGNVNMDTPAGKAVLEPPSDAPDKMIMIDGEEVPAWALEEIVDDPWTPSGPPGVVSTGLSAPTHSEFNGRALDAYQKLGSKNAIGSGDHRKDDH